MSVATKTIVLITGATSGIGYELAAQLLKKGSYHVLIGARSQEKGDAAIKRLQERNLADSVESIIVEVTDDGSIQRAAQTVEKKHGKLDMLINNAGIIGMNLPLREAMRQTFDTNATGTAVMTEAFAHLIKKSDKSPRIVNISSGAGSIGRTLDPTSVLYRMKETQYRASKAAMNMVTAVQWVEYGPDVKVFAFCPGFAQSNLTPMNTVERGAKPTEEAVMPLIDILEGKRDDEAGLFLHNSGTYPW